MTDTDVKVPSAAAKAIDPPTNWKMVGGGLAFPLFFVIMFCLCYVSAFHAPAPNQAPIVVVGPPSVTAPVIDGIEATSGGKFDIVATDNAADAIARIDNRDAIGAIEIGDTVTAHIATGAGTSTVSVVTALAHSIADQTGQQVTTVDSAPVTARDSSTVGLFYFLIVCTLGGYLTMTVLSQVAPRMRLREQYSILAGAAILTPLIAFGITSIFMRAFGASFGEILQLLGISMVYTFTVGAVCILLNRLLGQAAIFAVLTVLVFINFPSSGGAIPVSFLPGFWQHIHSFWLGSAAMEPIRSVIYFDGNGAGPHLVVLCIWLVAALGLTGLVASRQSKKAAAQ
ncbi:ABC transporter permease [Rhodococcus sp. 24CO]|uniref:ABC transporter permease n=1 Tax=Rhodococcus sp. 24CO TaxID=3117460 RepID=UPI003D349B07